MKKVSALDIRQSYTTEKARHDLIGWLWGYLVVRPISFHVTPLFINLGFSANAVTVLALITVICGLIFILSGATSPLNFIVGATLVNIYYLVDCIDGNISRFQGQSSEFGALFDCIVALIHEAFLPLCLGLGLYWAGPERVPLTSGIELPEWGWLVAGGVESSSGLFRRVVSLKSQSGVERLVERLEQENLGVPVWAVLPRAILSFKGPLLLIASLVGALGLFLLFYAAYNLVSLFAMTALSLRNALLVDRQQFDKGKNL
jgi:phosphatidylglycerophosphate synthase